MKLSKECISKAARHVTFGGAALLPTVDKAMHENDVCMCGEYSRDHGPGSNHSPVTMEEAPFQPRAHPIRAFAILEFRTVWTA